MKTATIERQTGAAGLAALWKGNELMTAGAIVLGMLIGWFCVITALMMWSGRGDS